MGGSAGAEARWSTAGNRGTGITEEETATVDEPFEKLGSEGRTKTEWMQKGMRKAKERLALEDI